MIDATQRPTQTKDTSPSLPFTYWLNDHQPAGKRGKMSWSLFCERFLSPKVTHQKKSLPGWAPALFHGDYRNLQNCQSVSALVFDYEKGSTTPQQAADFWANFQGALYTSYRHLPNAPRFRLILPYSRLVTPQEHSLIWAWAYAFLQKAGHQIDPACKDPSRLWYVPGHHPESASLYQAFSWDGPLLEVNPLLARIKQEAKLAKAAANLEKSRTPPRPRTTPDPVDTVERARLYLQRMDPAISGQKGHGQTLRAARVLVVDFGLDTQTALSLLLSDFNPRCVPTWTERELRHKVESALKLQGQRGKLLYEPRRNELSPPKNAPLEPKKATTDETKTTSAPPKTPSAEKDGLARGGARGLVPDTISPRQDDLPQVAPPKPAALPERYAVQLEQAKEKKAQAPEAKFRLEAAPSIKSAAREGLARRGEIRVVLVPCSGGKTYAVLDLVNEWTGEPIALIVKEHDLAEDIRLQAQKMGLDVARYHSSTGEGGPRHPAKPGQRKGDLICWKPRPTVLGHINAGTPGKAMCKGCPDLEICPAALGRIGPKNARLHLAPDQSPYYALKHAKHLIKDEWPELQRTYKATLSGLKMLADGDPSLMPHTRRVLQAVARDLLAWIDDKRPRDKDPFAPHNEALQQLTRQDDGRRRSELARDLDYRPNQALEHQGALAFLASWEAATTLIEAAVHGATLEYLADPSNPALVWYGKSPVAEALANVESAVILTATPGDLKALEKATGKKVVVVYINIKPVALLENTWKPDTNANRRYYIDEHGRPLFFLEEKKTPLEQHIQDTTQWIYDRPLISAFLLATYKPVAVGIRLAWARFRDLPPDKDDEKTWKTLHGNGTEAALQKALRVLDPLFTLLRERNITLDVIYYHAGAGLNHWRQAGKAFNACATLGNPNPNVDDHRRRYAEARTLDLAQLAPNDPDWQKEYDRAAANEETQQHGRLGDVGRAPEDPAFHLHIGTTLPSDWDETTVVAYRAPGRPRQQEPRNLGFDWRAVLSAALRQAGSVPKLARVLGWGENTVRRYLAGERAPNPSALLCLQELGGRARDGGSVDGPRADWFNLPEITYPSNSGTVLDSNYGKPPPYEVGRGRSGTLLLDSNYGKGSELPAMPPLASPSSRSFLAAINLGDDLGDLDWYAVEERACIMAEGEGLFGEAGAG